MQHPPEPPDAARSTDGPPSSRLKRSTDVLWGGAARARASHEKVRADDPARKLVGRVLDDRFSVDSVIGRGGMGVVYGGTDHVLDRPVVIKVLAPKAGRLATPERLIREARMACRVQHPAIVTVFHLGILDQEEPYVVMERLEGIDLATRLSRSGPVDADAVADLLEPIADALEALHTHGIVHRDVKPENVFVLDGARSRPLVKLIDFGLAILDTGTVERLTRAGQIVGTVEYLAPELVKGRPPTGASDVYALAVTAFELLTGRLPFEGKGLELLGRKATVDAERLAEHAVSPVTAAADAMMARALSRDITVRPSPHELVDALRAPRELTRRSRRSLMPAVAVVPRSESETEALPVVPEPDATDVPVAARAAVASPPREKPAPDHTLLAAALALGLLAGAGLATFFN